MSGHLELEPVARFPGIRVLTWHGGTLYGGCGYDLVRWRPGEDVWRTVGSWDPGPLRRLTSRHRLTARGARDGFHAVAVLEDGTIVAVVPKAVVFLPPGETHFRLGHRVNRGTRPLAVAVTPRGTLVWGEYFANPGREAVHVYESGDGGRSWSVAMTFPPGEIRHVHSVVHDPLEDCLWILTGDEDSESRIIRASTDLGSAVDVACGSQQARAVCLVPMEDGLVFGTDTPDELNHVYRLRRSGEKEALAELPASSFWCCGNGSGVFVSTGVEPSRVNTGRNATLWGSADGRHWRQLVEWPRDGWWWKAFQYANIILPVGENDTNLLAATGVAVKGEDSATHIWSVHQT